MTPEVRRLLFDAVLGAVRYKSGPRSLVSRSGGDDLWMFDLRPLLLRRGFLEAVADEFWHRFAYLQPFQVGAPEMAGVSLLTAILLRAPTVPYGDVSGFVVRKQRKAYGLCNSIEGPVNQLPVIMVDDIINSGDSMNVAVAQLPPRVVRTVFTIVDFGKAYHTHVTSLFSINDFWPDMERELKQRGLIR